MNEKIRELAEKAGWHPKWLTNEEHMVAFAKLIMEECADACNDFDCGRTVSAQYLINERFGITE